VSQIEQRSQIHSTIWKTGRGTKTLELDPDAETVARYQDLFGCSHEEAVEKSRGHHADLHDHLVAANEAEARAAIEAAQIGYAATYLILLEGPFESVEEVRIAAGLRDPPEMVTGSAAPGDVTCFCRIDEAAKAAILKYLVEEGSSYRPTFLQIKQAAKALSETSAAPFLGRDATLPQFRASSSDTVFRPEQDEHPVWYFFYGMLSDPEELSTILQLDDSDPEYRPAGVYGGELLSQRQLIDAPPLYGSSIPFVLGDAFKVENEKDEESLRFSVTDEYEVVRCRIEMLETGETGDGLTFRYNQNYYT
jgi:hypothetical protein